MALHSATTAKTLATSEPSASKPLDVFGAMTAIYIGNALKRWLENLRQAAAIALY
jgi:carbamate kinase